MQTKDGAKSEEITPIKLDLLYKEIKSLIENPPNTPKHQENFRIAIKTLVEYLTRGVDNIPLLFE